MDACNGILGATRVFLWLEEEAELRRLRRDLQFTLDRYAEDRRIAEARKADANELAAIEHGEYFEGSTISDQIDFIQTKRLTRKAQRYGIPVPRPIEGEDWTLSHRVGTWSLTEAGTMKLRREIASEVDIRQKPWLNWLSLVVSGVSLVVAVIALFVG